MSVLVTGSGWTKREQGLGMRVDGWQRNTDAHGRDCIYNTEDVFSNSNNTIKNYCLAHSVTVHDEVMRSFYQHGITLNRYEK
jgi:hypothetical protein